MWPPESSTRPGPLNLSSGTPFCEKDQEPFLLAGRGVSSSSSFKPSRSEPQSQASLPPPHQQSLLAPPCSAQQVRKRVRPKPLGGLFRPRTGRAAFEELQEKHRKKSAISGAGVVCTHTVQSGPACGLCLISWRGAVFGNWGEPAKGVGISKPCEMFIYNSHVWQKQAKANTCLRGPDQV